MENRKNVIRKHTDLDVYQRAFARAMTVLTLSKRFPMEERFSLTDQCHRSSTSVCANLTEAWRKRRYPAAFVAKLSDSEAEAAETQTGCSSQSNAGRLPPTKFAHFISTYDNIIGMHVNISKSPNNWTL